MNVFRKAWAWLKSFFTARYEGSQWDGRRSILPGSVQSARIDISSSTRLELVRKARYFEKNSGIVNRLADVFEQYTVGTGLVVNPASSDPEWNRRAKAWWTGWEEFPDLVTRQPFGTLTSLAARLWFIDGEAFILLTRGESGRPRLQVFESHLCNTPPEFAENEGKSIIDGVAIDGNGRPTGYWIANEQPDGSLEYFQAKPAEYVVHLFEPARAPQYRGLTFFAPVINDLHDLDDLQMLEMQAAKEAAEVTNVITNQAGELDPAILRRARFNQAITTNTGVSTTEERNRYFQDSIGGKVAVLRQGEGMSQFRSERPSVATANYWRYLTEKICAGPGIPYVLVFPDSMQGTVYRGALDMANSFFRCRSVVIAAAVRRIYAYVMNWARYSVPELRDAPGDWASVSINPPRAVNVDVGRNSSAMLAELEAGATNYELIYSAQGLDWREQFRKLREQRAYAKEIGLELASPTAGDNGNQEPEPGRGSDGDDEPVPAAARMTNGPDGLPRPWLTIRNAKGDTGPAEILIYDQIGKDWFSNEGVGAKQFADGLKDIPRNKEILVRINSPGGNVHDGLAIYHQLQARAPRVSVTVDGVAASIASVIALAGRRLTMPRTALYMIHDPSGFVVGTADDMRQMAEALDKHRDVILSVYQTKTGKSTNQLQEMMAEETWFTGEEAQEEGFADELLEQEPIAAKGDFSVFRRVPDSLKTTTQAGPSGTPRKTVTMKKKLIALLRKAGFEVADDASEETLFGLLDALGAQINDGGQGELRAEFEQLRSEVDRIRAQAQAQAQSQSQQTDNQQAGTVAGLQSQVADLQRRYEAERSQRIGARLDQAIAERPWIVRATWLPRCMADEAVLGDLERIPPQMPGAEPVRATGASVTTELRERAEAIPQGSQRWLWYQNNWADLRAAAISEDRRRSLSPMAANTMSANLTTDMLASGVITNLQNRWAPLAAFTRDFGTDRYKPRATVQIPNVTAGPTVQENASNFESGDVTVGAVAPSVSQWTASRHITNDQLNSGFRIAQTAEIAMAALADKVIVTATSVITTANYTATPVISAPAAFAWDDLKTLWGQLKKSAVKNILLDGEYFARFLPSTREGFDPNQPAAFGWDGFYLNTNWSGAGTNVRGFACNPQAIGVASGLPLTPPEIPGGILTERVVTIPGLGISISLYIWFSTSTRTLWASFDIMFGAAKADATAGVIIKSA